tara:strand:+ start:407 stop:781 length:375 start_codon:yes stop_codon:yes gene_type:complete
MRKLLAAWMLTTSLGVWACDEHVLEPIEPEGGTAVATVVPLDWGGTLLMCTETGPEPFTMDCTDPWVNKDGSHDTWNCDPLGAVCWEGEDLIRLVDNWRTSSAEDREWYRDDWRATRAYYDMWR